MSKKTFHVTLNQLFAVRFVLILTLFLAIELNAQTPLAEHDRFSQEINAFIQWDKKNSFPNNAILFVGSSSIRLWNTALSFPNLPIINRGFGGSEVSDVNAYYEFVVKKYAPSQIVFYAGDNDIAAGKSADQVFDDFKRFVENVARDIPGSQVFYIPIKPSISRWNLWPEMAAANAKIKAFFKNKPNLFYVDTASPMLDDASQPRRELFMDDGLHLNERGYQLWNEILAPYIERDHERLH